MRFNVSFLIISLLTPLASHAFDPFSIFSVFKGTGEFMQSFNASVEAFNDVYEFGDSAEEFKALLNDQSSLGREEIDLEQKLRRLTELSYELQYAGSEASQYDSGEFSLKTISENIRRTTRVTRSLKKAYDILKPEKRSEIVSQKIQNSSLETQTAILYQILSKRLEEKEREMRFKQDLHELVELEVKNATAGKGKL